MDLQKEILKEHSKKQTDKIIAWINGDQKKFDELVKLFLRGEYRVTQRAGWPMSTIAIKHPGLIHKHLKNLLLNAQKPGLHNAVLRNTVRLLQFVEIPKALHGLATETCFQLFNDRKQPVAVQVFSMTVLGRLCKLYPELIPELKLCIEEHLPYASAGFISRAKKVIKQLEKKD